jgi:hypothetical protein
MTRTDTIRLTITANTDTGEGYVTATNMDKLSVLMENPLVAMDVLKDWMATLGHHYALASAGFAGEMDRVRIDSGHRGPPALDDILAIYKYHDFPLCDPSLAWEYDWHGRFDGAAEKLLEAHTDRASLKATIHVLER